MLLLLALAPALAHPGGMDANGCHTNYKTGTYHCHGTPSRRSYRTYRGYRRTSGVYYYPSPTLLFSCEGPIFEDSSDPTYTYCRTAQGFGINRNGLMTGEAKPGSQAYAAIEQEENKSNNEEAPPPETEDPIPPTYTRQTYDCLADVCLDEPAEARPREVVTVAERKWLQEVEICAGKIVRINLAAAWYGNTELAALALRENLGPEAAEKTERWSTEASLYGQSVVEAMGELGWVFSGEADFSGDFALEAEKSSRLGRRMVLYATKNEDQIAVFGVTSTHPDRDDLCAAKRHQGL